MAWHAGSRLRLIVGSAALAGLLAGCSSSDLNSSMNTPVDDILNADPMVALGLRPDPEREAIEYGPRSPLVMPGQPEALPPPQQRQVAELDPAWPDDPDVRARREYEAQRQASYDETPREVEYASTAMTPTELAAWGRAHGTKSSSNQQSVSAPRQREENKVVDPRELLDSTANPQVAVAVAEPPRQSLVEPPPGYRTPAPNPDGTVPAQQPQKKGFFGRLFGQ